MGIVSTFGGPPFAFPDMMRGNRVGQGERSAVVNTFTGPVLKSIPLPGVEPRELLIRVEAASINPVDYKLAKVPFLRFLRPVLGFDFAGVVEQGSEDFPVGTRVFGEAEWGSLATTVAVRETLVHRMPETMSFEQAAATVMGFKTSFEALIQYGKLQAGVPSAILVLGASGGTGSFAIQIAKYLCPDSVVIGTCSGRNVEYVKSLGADLVIDYTNTPDIGAAVVEFLGDRPVDLVYDCVGERSSLALAARISMKQGVFVTIAQAVTWMDSWYYGIPMTRFVMGVLGKDLDLAVEMFEAGKLHVEIQQVYRLEQHREAFDQLRTQRTRGKLVLTMKDD